MNDEQPIIIIKKRGGHAGHHGGAWKVAYADFVTAMMAFFLVMWILGLNQETRKAIAAYFQDPLGMMKSQGGGSRPVSAANASIGLPSLLPGRASLEDRRRGEDNARFRVAKAMLERMIEKLPEFKELRRFIEITISRDGLRIELMEGSDSLFFESGSAQLKPQAVKLMRVIGRQLSRLPNPIILEGHTDARPYPKTQQGYSNWELSVDRANSARRAMVPYLQPFQVVEVRGYADKRLRNRQDPFHFTNRRISILVEYAHKTDAAETKQVGLSENKETTSDAPEDGVRSSMGTPSDSDESAR